MKAPETQTSKSKTFPKYRLFTLLLLAAMTSSALAGSFADRIRSETGMIINQPQEAMISSMPAPRLSGDKTDGSCLNTQLTFENEAARFNMHNNYPLPLRLWAIAHTGARVQSGQCMDMAFATQLWQSAIGNPVTGQLSELDVAELVRIVDKSNPQYAQTNRNVGMSSQERAVDMFLGPAQQGDTKAQFRVAFVYEGQKNYTEAVKWYRKAADQGLPQAQEKLGQMYRQGLGVDKNENEARKWLNMANHPNQIVKGQPASHNPSHDGADWSMLQNMKNMIKDSPEIREQREETLSRLRQTKQYQSNSKATTFGFNKDKFYEDNAKIQKEGFERSQAIQQQQEAIYEQNRVQEQQRILQQQNEWSRSQMQQQ